MTLSRYVLTGAPGAGKSVVLHALAARGYAVIEEAATDVIADLHAEGVDEPWRCADFCDRIVAVQRERELAPVSPLVPAQIVDRSPLCTLALARFLQRPIPPRLEAEVARVVTERVYQRTVFLVRPLGFIERTVARRISYVDALEFEAVHEAVYREHGYVLVEVPPGTVADRAEQIHTVIRGDLARLLGTAGSPLG